jgi:DNA-directed RNA polymerase specialized sigma24 family protein
MESSLPLVPMMEEILMGAVKNATVLLNDVNTAEDIVHDFFVSFAQSGRKLKLDGSLKGYLATCVVNRARDRLDEHPSL